MNTVITLSIGTDRPEQTVFFFCFFFCCFFVVVVVVFPTKKLIFFFISPWNLCCEYSLEEPQRGACNEYPQHIFSNKKKISDYLPYLETMQWTVGSSHSKTDMKRLFPGEAFYLTLMYRCLWDFFLTLIYNPVFKPYIDCLVSVYDCRQWCKKLQAGSDQPVH